MSAWIHVSEITDLHGNCQQILGRMKSRLDKYAARPNVNQDYLNELKKELVTLASYLQLSEETMAEIMVDVRETYRRGYANGRQQAEKENSPMKRRELLGNEGFRQERIARARQTWPELY